MKHQDPKQDGEERVWLPFLHQILSLEEVRQELKQGRNLGAGAEAEAMEGAAF